MRTVTLIYEKVVEDVEIICTDSQGNIIKVVQDKIGIFDEVIPPKLEGYNFIQEKAEEIIDTDEELNPSELLQQMREELE